MRNAKTMGIDTTLLWALLDESRTRVEEACLAVVGPGRTAMFFVSGPVQAGDDGDQAAGKGRTALIRHVCAHVAKPEPPPGGGGGAKLAQALLEPRERASIGVFESAGFLRLGDLAYLRRSAESVIGLDEPLTPTSTGEANRKGAGVIPLEPGVELWTVGALKAAGRGEKVDRLLVEAMVASYEQTLDCPELCGLRDPEDVLASHKAVGEHDPALWWVVVDSRGEDEDRGGKGIGCMMLTPCPEQESVELVYLGLGPSLRGKGLARRLLAEGLRTLEKKSSRWSSKSALPGGVTCAVDMRNTPALKLYRDMGFQQFATRVPLVMGLGGPASPKIS